MRSMSSTMKKKVASRIQTGENSMSASLWVGRPTTPLTDDNFLEKQTVLYSNNITKTSLAVCHPTLSRGATHIYFAYIESGEIKVTRTYYTDIMERHEWKLVEFSKWAEDVALCFDGTMPKAPNGWVEFKTEQVPWVFWVLNGVLYGQKLDDTGDPIVLAEANCSAVSAVRAMWSSYGSFDFGLVVFFLLNGQLYYRQLINGEWMDAEVVSFGPDGVKWEALAAFRTWDYRVGVQLKSADGAFYEMFTQFMGIGKQNAEHIEVGSIQATGTLTDVQDINFSEAEHVELSNIFAGAPYGGLYPIASPKMVSSRNIEDTEGNWGTSINVTFDVYLNEETVSNNSNAFTMIDSNGVTFMPSSAILDKETAKTVTLKFTDFNNASGECQIVYTPGSIVSLANIPVEANSIVFTPENLDPSEVEPPEPVQVWNLNPEGTEIAIEFSRALMGDIGGNEDKFTITTQEYDMVPGGTLQEHNKPVSSLRLVYDYSESVDLGTAKFDGTKFVDGVLKLEEEEVI